MKPLNKSDTLKVKQSKHAYDYVQGLKDEIVDLKDKLDTYYATAYYAIADMRHVGCRCTDTTDSMRKDLHDKFDTHHKAFLNIEGKW